MPRETRRRVDPRQEVNPISKPEAARVVARPVDQFVAPQQDHLLTQVASGLAAINPALAQYTKQKNTNDALAAEAEGVRQAQLQALDPNRAIHTPESMPSSIEPAFNQNFAAGYRETLGKRTADNLSSDFLAAWNEIRLKDDTDPEQFIAEWTAKNTAGFDDPVILNEVTKNHVAAVRAIRDDARGLMFSRMVDSQKTSIRQSYNAIRADQSNDERYAAFRELLPSALKPGVFTRTELAGLLLDRVQAISTAMGGAPELAELFEDYKDVETGRSLVEMNPQLAEQVATFKKTAMEQVERKLEKAMQPVHYQKRLDWMDLAARGEMPADEDIKAEIGPLAMFKTDTEALAFRNHLMATADKHRETQQGILLAQNGMLGALPTKEAQQKVMDEIVDPLIGPLFATMNTPGGEAEFNRIASDIINLHARSGGNVASRQLGNAFSSLKNRAPAPDAEPDSQFIVLANLYAQLPDNLKGVYAVDEDTRHLLATYSAAVEGRVDAKSAYQDAYRSISPEAKKIAAEFLKTPERQAEVRSWVKNEFTKDGVLPSWLRFQGLNTYPTNEGTVFQWAESRALELIRQNPNLAGQPDVLKKRLQMAVAESWVYDTSADVLVEVPRGEASSRAAEAVSEYTKQLIANHGKDAQVQLQHIGGGNYQVRSLTTGALVNTVTLRDILAEHDAKTALDVRTKEDTRLMAIHKGALAGTLTPELITQEADLIAKASALGILNPEVIKRIRSVREGNFKDSLLTPLDNVPKVPAAVADEVTSGSPGRSKTNLANAFWAQQRYGMALTVMGEDVVLRARRDNKGSIIGAGYNMLMNAKTLAEDFRRAGIPAEKIEGVKAGTVEITQDQAMRLLSISHKRAETTAKNHVDKKYGAGSWAKLPETKRAVLTDVAYQAGTPAKFPEAVERLIKDVGDARSQNPQVHFKRNGVMVADKRRNEMRLRMLGGLSAFGVTLADVTRKPRNMIESRALESQQAAAATAATEAATSGNSGGAGSGLKDSVNGALPTVEVPQRPAIPATLVGGVRG